MDKVSCSRSSLYLLFQRSNVKAKSVLLDKLWPFTCPRASVKFYYFHTPGLGYCPYCKCSKILNTFLFLFSNKMLVIGAGIHKLLVRIANREDLDQTASSEAL